MGSELMFEVITVGEARKIIAESWHPGDTVQTVPLLDAWGTVAAEDIKAAEHVPGFARATMDGYAVNAEDTFGASEAMPAYLTLVGEVPMGTSPERALGIDETMAVATGSALPEGANAVVMLEQTTKIDDRTVAVYRPVAPGENVMGKGEDVRQGQVVIRRGTVIRAQEMGVLASLGITTVKTYVPLRVGIVSTGNELVPPVQKPAPGQVRDSNSYMLYGLVREAGAQPRIYQLVPDEEAVYKETVRQAVAENDVVLVSGGSSVGTRDLTLKVLQDLGKLLFHGVAIKPGKPTLAAVVQHGQKESLIVGLPGHPVSAFVTFRQIVAPLLKRRVKEKLPEAVVWGELVKNVPSQAGREEHVRVRLVEQDGKVLVEPVFGKSGMLTTLTGAHGIVTVPLEAQGIAAGTRVPVKLFKEL